MKRMLLLMVMLLLPSSFAESMDRDAVRNELLNRLEVLTSWCMKHDEEISAGVLYSLAASLQIKQDTLLLQYLHPFNKRMVELLEMAKRQNTAY